jgi:hypothetical protein
MRTTKAKSNVSLVKSGLEIGNIKVSLSQAGKRRKQVILSLDEDHPYYLTSATYIRSVEAAMFTFMET